MKRISNLEYAILGLLNQQPQSGYDLRKQFATSPIGHYSDSPGSIYPALGRLQAAEWVAALQEEGGPRNRQRFALTTAGRKALHQWVTGPVTRAAVIWQLDQVQLRFAFMDQVASKKQALAFVEQLESVLVEYVAELESLLVKVGPGMASATGRLAFESGIEGYRTNLAWCKRARVELAEVSDEKFMDLEAGGVHVDVRDRHGARRNAGQPSRNADAGGAGKR